MKSRLFLVLGLSVILLGCGPSSQQAVERAARATMQIEGFGSANITRIVPGKPAARGAQELYCVATDATSPQTQLPYLLVVWRANDSWQAASLPEGYYEWDLQGCAR